MTTRKVEKSTKDLPLAAENPDPAWVLYTYAFGDDYKVITLSTPIQTLVEKNEDDVDLAVEVIALLNPWPPSRGFQSWHVVATKRTALAKLRT